MATRTSHLGLDSLSPVPAINTTPHKPASHSEVHPIPEAELQQWRCRIEGGKATKDEIAQFLSLAKIELCGANQRRKKSIAAGNIPAGASASCRAEAIIDMQGAIAESSVQLRMDRSQGGKVRGEQLRALGAKSNAAVHDTLDELSKSKSSGEISVKLIQTKLELKDIHLSETQVRNHLRDGRK